MAATSPAPAGEAPPRDIVSLFQLLLKATGVAGVLAVVGYIVLVAHQHFLGVKVDFSSVTELSFAAAAFWFDSVMTMLQQAQDHWVVSLAMLFCFAALWWPHLSFTRSSDRLHLWSELGIAALLIAIGTGMLVWYQLPTIQLHDVMIVGLCAQPGVNADTLLNKRTNRLWSRILDSREINLDAKCFSKLPVEDGRGKSTKTDDSLKSGYALTFLGAIAGWLLVYLRADRPSARWVRPFRTIGILALTVNTIMIPYTYGKLISPMTLPEAQVLLKDKVDSAATTKVGPRAASKSSEQKAPQATPKPSEQWKFGFLVAENDSNVVLLSFDRGVSRVLEIPRSEVTRLEITEMRDLLKARAESIGPVQIPKPCEGGTP